MRFNGRIPAVIYGRARNAESLSISANDINQVLKDGATSSTVIEITLDGKSETVLLREIQRHPVSQAVQHVDFYAIRAGETITVSVSIHLEGIPNGVRNAGGTLDQVLREVTISVLPRHIPERVSLDVSELDIGQSLHVSDLDIPEAKVMIDAAATICSVIAPRVEEVETPVEGEIEVELEEGDEPELIRKPKADEEGEGAETEG
jgi:large subunit ribosomal protein L25